jgi:hypothetical protein
MIAGAMRCGTTALATFLGSHPEVCFSHVKEPHFFDDPDFDDREPPAAVAARYHAEHFPSCRAGQIAGEATPIYLYLPVAIERIARYNPRMKFIVLLRDPVQRALSHYRHSVAHGFERAPLLEALFAEYLRLRRDRSNLAWDSSLRRHSYLDRGFYARQLGVLRAHFPEEQILVASNQQLLEEHEKTLRRIHAFLGVQDLEFVPPKAFKNTFGPQPAPKWLHLLLGILYRRDRKKLAAMTGSPENDYGRKI